MESLKKEERREMVQKFVSEQEFYTEQELTDAINKYFNTLDKKTSKPTIHRDLNALSIKKNKKGIYKPTETTKKLKFKKRYDKSKNHILSKMTEDEFDLEILEIKEGYAEVVAFELKNAKEEVFATFVSGNNILVVKTNKK
jgi:arginine repressor